MSTRITCETFLQHFKGLNEDRHDSNNVENSNLTEEDVENDALNKPITEEEVNKALIKLKNHKSCSSDRITNEFLKAAGERMKPLFTKLFNLVLNEL